VDLTQQQSQVAGTSWRSRGVATPGNLVLLLASFVLFPFFGKWTNAFAIGSVALDSPVHTRAIVKFCLFLMVFEWAWFFIAWFGIRRFGKVTFAQLVGGSWNRASRVFLDLGLGLGVLIVMLALGTVLQQFLSGFESSSAPLRSMVPQNALEASAYLAAALTAGFVEEFVFRGYLQKQLTAFSGSVAIGSALQILLFVQGHYFQGMLRLIPVALFGLLFTLLALWRKSLRPGMIAHGLGDGFGPIMFFLRLL
jgi:membrane protease YdiL (CAAX protease family)